MNCQDFESNIDGLARSALIDASEREAAREHEAECGPCAARLADERALTAGLRALASDTKDACADARVESALLAIFRARAVPVIAAEGVSAADSTQLFAHEAARQNLSHEAGGQDLSRDDERVAFKNFSWMKALSFASLAAAAVVAFFMLIPPDVSLLLKGNRSAAVGENTKGAQGSSQNATALNADVASESSTRVTESEAKQENDGSRDDEPVTQPSPQRRATIVPRATTASFEKNNVRGATQAKGEEMGVDNSGAEEIATDFIPLMQGGQFSQAEGGHLVRVELPRYALERFGLPVNAEAAGGRVKADVLLGDDGLARAIRFIR